MTIKNIINTLLAVTVALSFNACRPSNEEIENNLTIRLAANQKVASIIPCEKTYGIQYATRPMRSEEIAETYKLFFKAKDGTPYLQGVIIESKN